MTVQRRSIFGDPLPQGTGVSPDSPSQVDPITGATNKSYTAELPSARQPSGIDYGADAETNARYHYTEHQRAVGRTLKSVAISRMSPRQAGQM